LATVFFSWFTNEGYRPPLGRAMEPSCTVNSTSETRLKLKG
jgi:hypothetical protein